MAVSNVEQAARPSGYGVQCDLGAAGDAVVFRSRDRRGAALLTIAFGSAGDKKAVIGQAAQLHPVAADFVDGAEQTANAAVKLPAPYGSVRVKVPTGGAATVTAAIVSTGAVDFHGSDSTVGAASGAPSTLTLELYEAPIYAPGDLFTYDDGDVNSLSFSVSNADASIAQGYTFHSSGGAGLGINGLGTGTANVSFTASDSHGNSHTVTIAVTVTG